MPTNFLSVIFQIPIHDISPKYSFTLERNICANVCMIYMLMNLFPVTFNNLTIPENVKVIGT